MGTRIVSKELLVHIVRFFATQFDDWKVEPSGRLAGPVVTATAHGGVVLVVAEEHCKVSG
jgi:hypothetical protein